MSRGLGDVYKRQVVSTVLSISGKVKTLLAPPVVDAGACKDTDPEVDPTNFTVMLLPP